MSRRPYLIRYLIAPSQEYSDYPYHKTTRIYYQSNKTSNTDQGHLTWFNRIVQGFQKDEMFDVLWQYLGLREWREEGRYDVVNPFGDSREARIHSVWVFNTLNDVLVFMNREGKRSMPLKSLRDGPVKFEDMELVGPAVPAIPVIKMDPAFSYWKPDIQVEERVRCFLHPVLRDFNHQWRHLLRSDYNDVTLRVLGRAVVCLATLDFDVHKSEEWRFYLRYYFVWITRLPGWEPYSTKINYIGKVCVVLCQSIEEGLSEATMHLSSRKDIPTKGRDRNDSSTHHVDYLILSIRHIVLCHITPEGTLSHTYPEPLFTGHSNTSPPSDYALNSLLWALTQPTQHTKSASSRLDLLPTEIQDLVLHHTPSSSVASAKQGCELGIGSPFLWKDGTLNVGLEETYDELLPNMPVESVIQILGVSSGIVYRGRSEADRARRRLDLLPENM